MRVLSFSHARRAFIDDLGFLISGAHFGCSHSLSITLPSSLPKEPVSSTELGLGTVKERATRLSLVDTGYIF